MPSAKTANAMRLAVTAAQTAGPAAPILLRAELSTCLREAATLQYRGLEIHVPDIWDFDADAFAKACAATGVPASALVSGQLFVRKGLSLSDDDPAVVAKAKEGLRLFIDAAAKLRTGVVIGWVRGRIGDRDRNLVMNRQGGALAEVDAYAGEKNVPLYIEAINRYELDSLNTAADTVAFIREYGLKSSYAHLDTFHMNIEERSAAAAIRACGSLLGYFHVADNTRQYPGCGELNFAAVFDALREIDYSGFVSVECLPVPDGPEAARRAYAYLAGNFPFLVHSQF